MRTPKPTMSTEILVRLGRWHLAALDQFEETRPMGEGFQEEQDTLIAAGDRVKQAEIAMIQPRMALALGEIDVDTLLRKTNATCHVIDGGKGGSTEKALFPSGLTPVVTVTSKKQVSAVDALLDRARGRDLLEQEMLAPLLAQLKEARDRLAAALDQRDTGYRTLAEARASEQVAREDFCTAYSKNAGLIRSLFPNDRDRREFFFDSWTRSGSSSSIDSGEGETE